MNTKHTFADRTARMFALAHELRTAASEIEREAERMKIALERFAEKPPHTTRQPTH